MKNQMLFGQKIDLYFDEMMEDLEKLIAIPSVCEEPNGRFPFGNPCAEALDYILDVADRLGLATLNVNYYAGEVSYGEGDTCIDVLTHVDIVPASDGWDTNPYSMVRKGNFIYGRGMADDKGPAVAALYALKALKDASVKGNSTGGGTYARHANNTVAAFGPIFAGEPSRNVHGPNEFIDVDYFRQHLRICLEAMYRLFTAPVK